MPLDAVVLEADGAGPLGCPVAPETVKRGSPYKLLLGKPTDLPARRRAIRQVCADDLAALAGAQKWAATHPWPRCVRRAEAGGG